MNGGFEKESATRCAAGSSTTGLLAVMTKLLTQMLLWLEL
jgi:hypothetical protein